MARSPGTSREHALPVEIRRGDQAMTSFDERERSFEKKFALDEELKFRAAARRNRLLAEWAAEKLGLSGAQIDEYIKAVRKADLVEKGDDDVLRKVKQDLDNKGVRISETELRKTMTDLLATALRTIEAEAKTR
jgi:hypothetical protein